MQETVTNSSERKSVFTSFLDVLEAQDKKAQAERQLQEEKYLRRTQRIYDLHERQRGSVAELRRCVELVSQHAAALEGALRGASGVGGEGEAVPLAASLLRPAAALQRSMAQCVRNALHIRDNLAAAHRPHMEQVLAKMQGELQRWSSFVQRAVDVTYGSEMLFDNLHNMITEQRQCVREVTSSGVFDDLCEEGAAGEVGESGVNGGRDSPPHRPASVACSTPIARD